MPEGRSHFPLSQYRRVIISGGTGFIGRHLTQALVGQGLEVVVLTRQKDSHDRLAGVQYETFDFADREQCLCLRDSFVGCDLFFHLAAEVVWKTEFSQEGLISFRTHVSNPITLIGILEPWLRKAVLGSSIMVYPLVSDHDLVEGHDEAPPNFYGTHKLVLEKSVEVWARAEKKSFSVMRIAQAYGPGMRANRFLLGTIDAALAGQPIELFGDGSPRVDWIYIADVVDGLIQAAAYNGSDVFNIASGHAPTNREVAETIVRVTGSSSKISNAKDKPAADRRQVISIRKANELLGYQPQFDLEAGIRHMLETSLRASAGHVQQGRAR